MLFKVLELRTLFGYFISIYQKLGLKYVLLSKNTNFRNFYLFVFFSAHFTERHLQKISSALKSFCLNVGLWFWLLKLKRSRDRAKWRCCSYLFSALIQECHLGSQAFLMASILSFFNYALKPSQNGRDSGRAFKNR